MSNSQLQLGQQVSVLSRSHRRRVRPRPAMRAPGAPLARTSRLLLLLLLEVSASPALGSAPAPRNEHFLGESGSSTRIQRRSRDAWGPGNSAGDLLPTGAPMEREQAAAVLSAPSWDLLEARRSDPGAGRGAGAAAAEPSGPPGRPPGAWRWKGARSQEPPETLGRGNPRALQLFPHTAEEKDKGPRSAGISGRSQEQGVRTEPGAGDLYYWPRRTGKLQGSHHDPQPKMVNGPSWHEGRTIAPPGRALAQNGSSLEGVHERGGPRRGNSTNPRLQLKNPFYPLTQESYGAYAVMCLSVVIFGTGIIGNLAVMCIVCHNYYMRSISNSLLANLAFWDFLIIFFCLPLVIFHELTKKWLLEDFSCKIVPYIEVCLPGVSSYWLYSFLGFTASKLLLQAPTCLLNLFTFSLSPSPISLANHLYTFWHLYPGHRGGPKQFGHSPSNSPTPEL